MHIPESVTLKLDVAMALASSDFAKTSVELDHELHPVAAQYELGADDYAVVASSSARVDSDFTVAQILNPEGHADQFPDWEDRIHGSFVLCQWHSLLCKEGALGWFARAKLIPIEESQHNEVLQWLDGGKDELPTEPPEWVAQKYDEYTTALSNERPGVIPRRPACGECGSKNVQLHAMHITRIACMAGEVEEDDGQKMVYSATSEPTRHCETMAHLHCNDCNARAEIESDELAEGFKSGMQH